MTKKRKPSDIVKSCYKMESGLRLGQEGIHACQLGPFSSPIYFTESDAAEKKILKSDLIEKRRWIFELLNDPNAKTPCKDCSMVIEKEFKDVRFDLLGHVDLAATTTCNLRCNFCGYTQFDSFDEAKYDALAILKEFKPEDVTWNSAVDFNGGEPTLLKDFDDYIKYFEENRTRVFLFTNGLIYKQSVYDGILNGAIRWVIVSLDAGTKSTYKKMKLSPKFDQVLENIARYSEAGETGNGGCAVKYIFHEDNCNDDDVLGFSTAMLALRPQEVWLTFDFDPLCSLPANCEDLGGYDYTPHIEAYAKVYLMLEKHGMKAVHYAEKHLAPASRHGVILLEMVKKKIDELRRPKSQSLKLRDFRSMDKDETVAPDGRFQLDNGKLEIFLDDDTQVVNMSGKNAVLAPASPQIREFISHLKNAGVNVTAILDKDKVLQDKVINGIKVLPYEDIEKHQVDMALVATTNIVIEPQIIAKLRKCAPKSAILTFNHKQSTQYDKPVVAKTETKQIVTSDSLSNEKQPYGGNAVEDLIKWARHTSG